MSTILAISDNIKLATNLGVGNNFTEIKYPWVKLNVQQVMELIFMD